VARILTEHVPECAFGLVTAAVPVPATLLTNGDSVFPSKLVAVTSVPVKVVLAGAAKPVRHVAAMAAFADPKIKLPDTSSPRLPSVPIFFRVLMCISSRHRWSYVVRSTAAFRLTPGSRPKTSDDALEPVCVHSPCK
jgi:hypothetical protein